LNDVTLHVLILEEVNVAILNTKAPEQTRELGDPGAVREDNKKLDHEKSTRLAVLVNVEPQS
jgi:hypothetical protein